MSRSRSGGGLVLALGVTDAIISNDNGPRDGAGDALIVIGGIVVVGNWVWSIFSGIEDARAAGSSGGSAGGLASIIHPRLVPLEMPLVLATRLD